MRETMFRDDLDIPISNASYVSTCLNKNAHNYTYDFLVKFKSELAEAFGKPMDTERSWEEVIGSYGWYVALTSASNHCKPEILILWESLDWWASYIFDEWIIKCAVYATIIEKDPRT